MPEPTLPGFGARRYPADFLEWWPHYPLRIGKKDAAKAWHQTRHVRPTLRAMIRITDIHAAYWAREKRKIPHPATWIRAERWEDEFIYQVPVVDRTYDREGSPLLNERGEPVMVTKTWTPEAIFEEERQ